MGLAAGKREAHVVGIGRAPSANRARSELASEVAASSDGNRGDRPAAMPLSEVHPDGRTRAASHPHPAALLLFWPFSALIGRFGS